MPVPKGVLLLEDTVEEYVEFRRIFETSRGWRVFPEVASPEVEIPKLYSKKKTFADLQQAVTVILDGDSQRISLVIVDLKLQEGDTTFVNAGAKLVEMIREYAPASDHCEQWGALVPIIAVSSWDYRPDAIRSVLKEGRHSATAYFGKTALKRNPEYFMYYAEVLRANFVLVYDEHKRDSSSSSIDIQGEIEDLSCSINKIGADAEIIKEKVGQTSLFLEAFAQHQNVLADLTLLAVIKSMDQTDARSFANEYGSILKRSPQLAPQVERALLKDASLLAGLKDAWRSGSVETFVEHVDKLMDVTGLYKTVPCGEMVGKVCGLTLCTLAKLFQKATGGKD